MSRVAALVRLGILALVGAGVALGVRWFKNESPHPVAADASRESSMVEARSLKPLLETAEAPRRTSYAISKSEAADDAGTLFPVLVSSQPAQQVPETLPVWLVSDGAGSAEKLRQILRDRGARQMGEAVRFAMLNLGELLGMTGKAWAVGMAGPAANENEASALLLTFYLYHLDRAGDGAGVKAFREALRGHMPQQQAVGAFILAGRSVAELESEMGRLYHSVGIDLSFTRRGGRVFEP